MAYKVIKDQKIPDSNIIYMTYNNIADNKDNPHQGDIYNWPTADNCYSSDDEMDYTGDKCTADIFLAVLKGDSTGTTGGGPVLKSDANSTVFIFYSGASAGEG